MAVLEYSYDYAFASAMDDRGLRWSACGGAVDVDLFFRGKLRQPRAAGQMLSVLAAVVRTHFFEARPPNYDPVVTTSPAAIRWEGFSGCCGAYARVDLDERSVDPEKQGFGTTNVDFNAAMTSHLARLGLRDEVELSISRDAVAVREGAEESVERKVELPHRWIKGLSEVQVYQSKLAPKWKVPGHRLLRFIQSAPKSGFGVQHLVQSGSSLRLTARAQAGSLAIGGVERLRVLAPLLGTNEEVAVWADDSSGVSGWQVPTAAGTFWYVLSPELQRGFSGEGQVLEALTNDGWQGLADRVLDEMRGKCGCDPAEIAARLGMRTAAVKATMMALSTRGLAGFDAATGFYFHRELPFSLDKVDSQQPRLKAAHKLLAEGRVKLHERPADDAWNLLVEGDNTTYFVRIRPDGDKCGCPWFSKYQGERGPCKHLLAARLLANQAP